MNVELAFFHACKRYPGGITAVAHLLKMNPDVLQKKLSPTCTSHHLNVDEAELITELVGDPAGAIELARAAGMACIPMAAAHGEGSLHKGMADVGKEFSDLMNEFSEATRDNKISPNECDRFQREAIELFSACMAELARMRVLAATRAPVVPIREAG